MNRYASIFAVVWLCVYGLTEIACAQRGDGRAFTSAPLEITVAYSADRTNGVVGGCGCFWMSGGMAEAQVSFLPRGISAVAELTGEHASSINSAGQSLNFVSYLLGPRISWHNPTRFLPFAQFLIGCTHGFGALFPNAGGPYLPNPDAFSFASGAGLNWNVSRRIAFRIVQVDYLQTHLPNDTNNRQDHLRIVAGIVWRIGKSKN